MYYILATLLAFCFSVPMQADASEHASPWQINLQPAASPTMHHLHHLHDILLVIIFVIVAVVLGLLIYTCIRYRSSRNPVPSKRSHHVILEVIWTLIPCVVLLFLAFPSIKSLFFVEDLYGSNNAAPEMTIKIVGHQWYWSYEYPDNGNFGFDSYIVADKDLKPGQLRLLSVDNNLVLPVNTRIRILITSSDVIHSWAVPAFGIKKDAVPGRVNETWVQIYKPGMYYGQCSELCGVNHGFMPIAIQAVTPEEFAIWVEGAKKKFAYSSIQGLAMINLDQIRF